MKINFLYILIFFIFQAGRLFAFEYRTDFSVSEELSVSKNYYYESIDIASDGTILPVREFSWDDTQNSIRFFPEIDATFDYFRVAAALDISWEYYRGEESDTRGDISFQTVFAEKKYNNVTLHAGLLPFIIGDGFLLYSNEPGIHFEQRVNRRIYFELQGALLFDKSPFISTRVEYRLSLFEKISVFGCFLNDKDSKVIDMFENLYFTNLATQTDTSETDDGGNNGGPGGPGPHQGGSPNRSSDTDSLDTLYLTDRNSSANIFWAGGTAEFFIGPVYVKGTPIFQFGDMTIETETTLAALGSNTRSRNLSISAYLFDLEFSYKVNDFMAVSAFCFFSSGDNTPLKNDFQIFFAPMPLNPRAPVFFDGFGTQGYSETITPMGVFAHGVYSPGMSVTFNKGDKMFVTFSGTYLFPDASPPGSGMDTYGVEGDISLKYKISPKWQFFAEVGVFSPGSYFDSENTIKKTAYGIDTGIFIHF